MSIDLNTNVHIHRPVGHNEDLQDSGLVDNNKQRKMHDNINEQEQQLVSAVQDLSDAGTINDISIALASGQSITDEQVSAIMDAANKLSPDELKQMAAAGLITDQEADMLIVAGGIKNSGTYEGNPNGVENAKNAFASYLSMAPDQQEVVLDQFSQITVDHNVTVLKGKNKVDNEVQDLTNSVSASNPAQERTALFLATANPENLSDVSKFVNWDFDSSDGALASALGGLNNWHNLSETQQQGMVSLVQSLGGDDPIGIPPPNDLYNMLAGNPPGTPVPPRPSPTTGEDGQVTTNDDGDVTTGERQSSTSASIWKDVDKIEAFCLMVLADKAINAEDKLRSFAEQVQSENDEIHLMNNAMAQLNAKKSTDSTVKTDITKIPLDDGRSLAQYLDDKGIPRPDSDELSADQVADLLTSMKNESDTMSSTNSLDMAKLQQYMNEYNQAITLLSNAEALFKKTGDTPIGNIR